MRHYSLLQRWTLTTIAKTTVDERGDIWARATSLGKALAIPDARVNPQLQPVPPQRR
jgi:hypothetical protein